MMSITAVYALEILDSRGNPTVYARVTLDNGGVGISAVPSGASTGKREAVELRDGDRDRFGGKGVLQAVSHINGEIASVLTGMDGEDQDKIDETLIEIDGTPNKSRLGANAMLAVSIAVVRAVAYGAKKEVFTRFAEIAQMDTPTEELPVPLLNILNGGVHAAGSTDFQEFMVAPIGMQSFSDALRAGAEIYHTLENALGEQGLSTNVGFEGGFAPHGLSNRQALGFITQAIEESGYSPGKDIFIALDPAASEFYSQTTGHYNLRREGRRMTSDRMIEEYEALCKDYPIFSIEDGLSEDDWEGWTKFTARCGNYLQLVGDDLFVTQERYIERGIREKAGNAVLIKFNQAGTVTETLAAIRRARDVGMGLVVSHRSGETEDTTIADMAVGLKTGQIKAGAPARSERVAKYNRLLRIEELLGERASYAGPRILERVKAT